MDWISHNGQIIREEDFSISHKNRKFKYSDGFFETIIIENSQVKYWDHHWKRIFRAVNILQIKKIPEKELLKSISELLAKTNTKDGIINIQFSRNEGGLYTPSDNSLEYYIIIREDLSNHTNHSTDKIKTGISRKVCNRFSPWSFFKNESITYVLAGLEKNKKGWDDIIILDERGYISECLSSNIFWLKDSKWYTPNISTGCIDGIGRNVFLEELRNSGEQVEIGLWKSSVLKTADKIIRTNVTGRRELMIEW